MASVSFDNRRTCHMDHYFYDFEAIWKRDFEERSGFDLWMHVVDHASRVARAIRRQQPSDVIDDIADTAVWVFSFISHCAHSNNSMDKNFKLTHSPSKIIWGKYCGTCPACFSFKAIKIAYRRGFCSSLNKFFESKDDILHCLDEISKEIKTDPSCSCFSRESNYVKERDDIRKHKNEFMNLRIEYANKYEVDIATPKTFGEFQFMFDRIYGHVNRFMSLEQIAFHFLEEIGDATRSLKDLYTYDDSREPYTKNLHNIRVLKFYEEIADVFSWLYAIVLKLNSTYIMHAIQYISSTDSMFSIKPEACNLSFSDIIWAKYGRTKNGGNLNNLICPGCQNAPCKCPRDLKIAWSSTAEGNNIMIGNVKENEICNKDLVFISYCHDDAEWLDKLEVMLKPLVRGNTISSWSDRDIKVGQKWADEITSALRRAKVAVLLVSANFLASDFIADNEIPPLLDNAEIGGTKIIWIPISSCLYDEVGLGKYQAACDPKSPLDGMSDSDKNKVLANICRIIKEYATG